MVGKQRYRNRKFGINYFDIQPSKMKFVLACRRINIFSYQNGTAVNVFGPYDPNAKMQMVYDTDSLDSSYIEDAPLVVAPPRRPPPPIPKQLEGVGTINKLHNSASRKKLLSDIRKIGNLTKPSVILKKLNQNHR